MFVIDTKISDMVTILSLDNPLGALDKTPCTPLWLAFAISYQQCLSSQGVLQVNIMPLRVENNLKSVKQHISNFAYELLIDIRKEASMTNVVQQS